MDSNLSLVERLLKRAEIRRKIPRGEPDRIADILEEAAKEIISLRDENQRIKEKIKFFYFG
jgi:BioD-like phosphotransacetylase family protein